MASAAKKIEPQAAALFPMFVKLQGRPVLVVGAGSVGEGKIRALLETGARIRVVATQAIDVVATSRCELNELVYAEAQRRCVLCNVVDVPEQCDFYYPAIVRRGDLQIAISTSGQSPALARNLRQQLEAQFGPGYADWVSELGATRRDILNSNLTREQKRELLMSLAGRPAFEAMLAKHSKHSSGGDAA